MKKLLIAQPVRNMSQEDINRIYNIAWDTAEHETGENLVPFDIPKGEPLENLGNSIIQMAQADYVIFVPMYGMFKNCRILQIVAAEYGKKCLYMRGE